MKLAVALLLAVGLRAQDVPKQDVPKDVTELLRTAADALAQKDAEEFLGKFDRRTPGYGTLEAEVRSLVDRSEVSSTIEIVSSEGDEKRQKLQLDWYLRVDDNRPKRQIVTVTMDKQGRRWKITAFDPVEFFAP